MIARLLNCQPLSCFMPPAPLPSPARHALVRDLALAGLSFALDVLLFALVHHVTGRVFFSVVLARVLSALFNFAGNRLFVFKGRQAQTLLSQLLGYAALAVAIMLCSATLLQWLVAHWQLPAVPAKVAVDVLLYLVSFYIRRTWLFRLH